MNRKFIILTIVLTIFAAGCTPKATNSSQDTSLPNAQETTSSLFALPDDASNITTEPESVNFQSGMTLEEAILMYRDEFINKQGLAERGLVTVVNDTNFSIVFDGSENGMAVVVQGVQLDENSININIRYEDN
jgi:hypothetical protein